MHPGHRRARNVAWLLLAALLPGCGRVEEGGAAAGAGAVIVVVDDAGRTVALSRPPRRIISLIPAVTEVVIALGAGDRLVARTDHDANPVVQDLPSAGGGLTPNLEWLASLRPDLVLGWADGQSRSALARLSAGGVATYGVSVESLAEADATMRRLGVLLGDSAAGDSLARATAVGLEEVRRRVADRPPPTVLYLLGTEPPSTVGPGSFIHELLETAGGRNAFEDAPAPWPRVSLEEVVARDPDVILVPDHWEGGRPAERLASLAHWRELRAVRSGRVYSVDETTFHRWGPHVPAVAARMAEIFHGVAAPDGGTR